MILGCPTMNPDNSPKKKKDYIISITYELRPSARNQKQKELNDAYERAIEAYEKAQYAANELRKNGKPEEIKKAEENIKRLNVNCEKALAACTSNYSNPANVDNINSLNAPRPNPFEKAANCRKHQEQQQNAGEKQESKASFKTSFRN
jgi:hypothetical protein